MIFAWMCGLDGGRDFPERAQDGGDRRQRRLSRAADVFLGDQSVVNLVEFSKYCNPAASPRG